MKLSCYLFFGSILIGYILAILFSAINMIIFGLEANLFDYHLSSSDKMGGRLELIWSLDGLLWPQVISKNILVSIYSVSSILVPFVFFQLLGRKIFGFSLLKASIFSMFSFLYVSIVFSFLYWWRLGWQVWSVSIFSLMSTHTPIFFFYSIFNLI